MRAFETIDQLEERLNDKEDPMYGKNIHSVKDISTHSTEFGGELDMGETDDYIFISQVNGVDVKYGLVDIKKTVPTHDRLIPGSINDDD